MCLCENGGRVGEEGGTHGKRKKMGNAKKWVTHRKEKIGRFDHRKKLKLNRRRLASSLLPSRPVRFVVVVVIISMTSSITPSTTTSSSTAALPTATGEEAGQREEDDRRGEDHENADADADGHRLDAVEEDRQATVAQLALAGPTAEVHQQKVIVQTGHAPPAEDVLTVSTGDLGAAALALN